MSNLAQLQAQFLSFLQNQDNQFSEFVADQAPVATDTRLGIYNNAYHVRLKEAIDNDHPILGTYLGDELYDQLVAAYIKAYPSKVKSLRYFCTDLPQLLSAQSPFNEHPILTELAAFERLLLDVFDAQDSKVSTVESLGQIPPEQWPQIGLIFHPTTRLFSQMQNAVETWQALKGEKTPPSVVSTTQPSYWILWRNPSRLTEFYHLSELEFSLWQLFNDGGNFSQACELLSEFFPPDQVPVQAVTLLQQWLNYGLVQEITT